MSQRSRFLIVTFLLLVAIVYSYAAPKPKYSGVYPLSRLDIPLQLQNWQGDDMTKQLDTQVQQYGFLSGVIVRMYHNDKGEKIALLVFDAGNFHSVAICFDGAGYSIRELNDTRIDASRTSFRAHTLYAAKGSQSTLLVYWMCVDGKIADSASHRVKQLWYSLVEKSNAGLMVRLDIPTAEADIPHSLQLAREFISELARAMPADQAEFLFGKAQ